MQPRSLRSRFAAALGCLAAVLTACQSPPVVQGSPLQPESDQPYLVVLGTAQDGGLPQIACRKACCEAVREDPSKRRLVTCLLLVDPRDGRRWLFDATPHLPLQVERARGHGGPADEEPGRPALFDGVFLTHGHLGHYTGLMHLGREAYGSAPAAVIGTPRMLGFLQSNGPWSLLFEGGHATPTSLRPGATLRLADDLAVTAIAVPHRDEFTDTVGFVIHGPEHSALYLPDIDKWQRWDAGLVETLEGVDLAFLDGTFYGPAELPGRDMAEVPHPFIVESMELLAGLPDGERAKVHFTHLNHSNPATDPGSDAARSIRAAGMSVLAEGTVFGL